MFNFFKTKKKNTKVVQKKTECNCVKIEDQEILIAHSVNKIEAIKSFLEKNGYDYNLVKNGYNADYFNFFVNEESLGNCIADYESYDKCACVSCKKCLGWKDSNKKKIGKDLNAHIQNIIDKHIRKIEDTKRKQELAKEICGVNNV